MEFETVWSGSDKTVYLCIPPDTVPDMSYVRPANIVTIPRRHMDRTTDHAPYQDWSLERARALQLLPTRERWRIRDLRCLLGLTPPVMSGIMQRLRRDRVIRSLGHGIIAYRRVVTTVEDGR